MEYFVPFDLPSQNTRTYDNLLFDIRGEAADFIYALNLLKNCSEKELRILIDIMKTLQKNR